MWQPSVATVDNYRWCWLLIGWAAGSVCCCWSLETNTREKERFYFIKNFMVLWQIEFQATQDRLLLIIQINISIKDDIINSQSWEVEILKNVYKHSIRFFLDLRHAPVTKTDLWVYICDKVILSLKWIPVISWELPIVYVVSFLT